MARRSGALARRSPRLARRRPASCDHRVDLGAIRCRDPRARRCRQRARRRRSATARCFPSSTTCAARDIWVKNPALGFVQPRVSVPVVGGRRATVRRCPAVGRDTDAVRGAAPARRAGDHRRSRPGRRRRSSPPRRSTGMRVFDLTTYWAGPYAAQILGWLGADVIKVESVQRPDGTRIGTAYATKGPEPWEEAPLFHGANTGKRDITLDMTRAEGQVLGRRLARALRRVRRELHAARGRAVRAARRRSRPRQPGSDRRAHAAWGLAGPWRDRPGFAQNMEQVTGLAWITGYLDGPPVVPRGPCDPIGGLHAAFAVLACLWIRERSGSRQVHRSSAGRRRGERRRGAGHRLLVARPPLGAPGKSRTARRAAGRLRVRDGAKRGSRCRSKTTRSGARSARRSGLDATARGPSLRRCRRRAGPSRRARRRCSAAELSGREVERVVGTLLGRGCRRRAGRAPGGRERQPAAARPRLLRDAAPSGRGQGDLPGVRCPLREPRRAERQDLHTGPPPLLGQHNRDVLGGLLGLSDAELAELERTQIIGTRPAGR